jgi:ABC-type phosphate transport system permease subunit
VDPDLPLSEAVLQRLRRPWPDHRAERTLGAVALCICLLVLAMIAFVAQRAWPTFSHEGLSWMGSGGDVQQQMGNMLNAGANPPSSAFHVRAWPILYGTLLTVAMAVPLALALALLASVFIVELAPRTVRRVAIPVIRLLASVPSVIYGLIGVLVLVPFVGNHLITQQEKASVQNVVELTGAGLGVAVAILTVMITPIMIALICEALSSVPNSWREGALALGLNPVRAIVAVTLRAIRPAIVAATVLATARALGEAVMIQMVSGSRSFAPKPVDGWIFFFEPLRSLASAIIDNTEGFGSPALRSTVYAFAFLLLFSAFALSLAGYLIKLPLRRHQVQG